MHFLTAVISPTMYFKLLMFIKVKSYIVCNVDEWDDVTAARHDELPHRGSVRASYVEAWGGAATTDGSGARFKARRVVDPERASHRCHYHHGLAPSPALTPTRHHCNCDPISPHRSSIHSQTLLPPASTTNKYPHIQQQVRTTNWSTLEHHIYQWLIIYQRKEKSSITNPCQIFIKHVSIIWLSPWFLQRSYS